MNAIAASRALPGAGEPERAAGAREAKLLGAIACAALALGVLVYLTDRAAGSAAWLPAGAWGRGAASLFGSAGPWLPSFVHPFALALLTVALRPVSGAPALRVCAAWWAVNVAFELGQLPTVAAAAASALQAAFGQAWPAQVLANYLLRGTFDRADLLAATAGAWAAACVIPIVVRPGSGGEPHEQG